MHSTPTCKGLRWTSAGRRPRSTDFGPTTDFATTLLPPIEQLLTVGQVAQLLGFCTATVYKWAAQGVLRHVRIVNTIRIRPQDLSALIAPHRDG